MARLPNLRAARIFPALREALRLAQRDTFRICHFSVQSHHVHMLAEAKSREALSRGVQSLAIRLALTIDRTLGRRGKVWADRFHARALTTPREVRNALVYVLNNFRKHRAVARAIDWCSSAPWFAGWRELQVRPPGTVEKPVLPPRTWLLSAGWLRHGPIEPDEAPRSG